MIAPDKWIRIHDLTREHSVRSLNDKDIGHAYERLLSDIRFNRTSEDEQVLGMERAPASKDRHHSYEGGLVDHLLEMWDLWIGLKNILTAHVTLQKRFEAINDSNVWLAILHHDLNKVWRYKMKPGEGPGAYAIEYAEDHLTELLGAQGKSVHLLSRHGIYLSTLMYNALICSEGGFSKTRTHSESVFAKIIYILDELSANVVNRLHYDRFWDSQRRGPLDEHL